MDDKTKPLGENAEYTFTGSGEETSNTNVPEATVSEELQPIGTESSLMKRFLVPLLMMGSILLIYLGFNFYSAKKTQLLEQKKVAVQAEAAFVQKQETKLEAEPKRQVPVIKLEVGSENELAKKEQDRKIQETQEAIQQKVDSFMQQMQQTNTESQERVSSLSASISKVEQEVSSSNQKMEQLNVIMQQMSQDMEKIKVSLQKPTKKVVKPLVPYHVKAIVPGRVWLEAGSGKIVTLRVGDKLEGYGEVRVISPKQGMIIMSNGSIIQYGVDDF